MHVSVIPALLRQHQEDPSSSPDSLGNTGCCAPGKEKTTYQRNDSAPEDDSKGSHPSSMSTHTRVLTGKQVYTHIDEATHEVLVI